MEENLSAADGRLFDRWFLADFAWANALGQYDCDEDRYGLAVGRAGSALSGVRGAVRRRCNKCWGCFCLQGVKQRARLQAGFRTLPRFAEDHKWPLQELMRSDWAGYLWQTGRFLTLTWDAAVPYETILAKNRYAVALKRLRERYPGLMVYSKLEHQGRSAEHRLHLHALLLNVPADALVWQGAVGALRDLTLKEWLRLERVLPSAEYKWRFWNTPGLGISECSRLRIADWDKLMTYLCKEMYHGYDDELSAAELDRVYSVPPSWRRVNRYNPGALWRMSAERVYEDGPHSVVPLWKVAWDEDVEGLPGIGDLLAELAPGYTADVAGRDLAAAVEGGAVVAARVDAFLERFALLNRERSRYTAYREKLLSRLVGVADVERRVVSELGPWAAKLLDDAKVVTAQWRETGLEPWLRRQLTLLRLATAQGTEG